MPASCRAASAMIVPDPVVSQQRLPRFRFQPFKPGVADVREVTRVVRHPPVGQRIDAQPIPMTGAGEEAHASSRRGSRKSGTRSATTEMPTGDCVNLGAAHGALLQTTAAIRVRPTRRS